VSGLKRIILTGGGTAGHVTPNLALIPLLQKEGWEIHYIGSKCHIENSLVSGLPGVTFHGVASGKLRRYFDLKNFTDPARVIKGAAQSVALIRRLKPQLVFSKGGFISVPVVFGAALCRVPAIIHESDMTLGLSNRLSGFVAAKIMTTFPEAALAAGKKGVVTGTPLRAELLSGSREKGLKLARFTDSRPVLMVTGGSSGAQSINAALRHALPRLLNCFQILHLCGKGNLDTSLEGTDGYYQREYMDEDMAHAYAAADVMISRAGSNTLCEILALRKPALLIPYPKAASRGDQLVNAASFEARGLAKVLLQGNMTETSLTSSVVDVYHNRGPLIDAMCREPAGGGAAAVMAQIRAYDPERAST